MATTEGKKAWVTLATNDSYAIGALVLAHSLREVQTRFPMVVLVSEQVSLAMRSRLSEVFSEVHDVNILDSNDSAHLALLARPELGVTFTKLHCWALTHLEKAVFLDADTLVVQNCDELFDREELSAAPDAGWPDCFNSGVFVFKPSLETYNSLLEYAVNYGSFDGGDQGLLNAYFSDWATKDISKHLPFVYNMTATASYSYLPAQKRYGSDVRIAHLIGYPKPWQLSNVSSYAAGSSATSQYIQHWWTLFDSKVKALLNSEMRGVAAMLENLDLNPVETSSSISVVLPDLQLEEERRRHREAWERGDIDYTGRDSFENIMAKMKETISRVKSNPVV